MSEIKNVEEDFVIPIDNISIDFKEHLEIVKNNNLLFSWKYWLWKTYFLKEFFKDNEDYEVFHLFPINYQISSNEDIVDLLKYDILIELFEKNKDIFKDNKIEDFTDFSSLLYLFWENNKLEILRTILWFFWKLWRPLKDTVWLLEKLWDFKKEIEKWDKWITEDFFKKIEEKGIYENDYISQLIKEKINEVKWNKKSILILDDLDRMDPEHIFRIMNIFWAHFNVEHKTDINKFWFDKIILVWDYDNFKSIFNHKYWEKTDFNWYINKFYSSEIYFFDNSLIIKSKIIDIIQKIKYWDDYFKRALELNVWYIEFLLKEILEQSVLLKTKNALSVRELLKWTKYIFSHLNNKRSYIRKSERFYIFETGLKILIIIFWWKKDNLINILNDIKKNYIYPKYFDSEITYQHIIFDFINDLYKIKDINNKWLLKDYDDFFENDVPYIRVKESVKEKNLINVFYDVLIDYIEQKL